MSISLNINLYIDNGSLDKLITSYDGAIKTLTDLYLKYEKMVNGMESNEHWKGNSFDEFKKKFEEWKLEYLKKVAELTQLKDFLGSVKATSETLIQARDNLKLPLEA